MGGLVRIILVIATTGGGDIWTFFGNCSSIKEHEYVAIPTKIDITDERQVTPSRIGNHSDPIALNTDTTLAPIITDSSLISPIGVPIGAIFFRSVRPIRSSDSFVRFVRPIRFTV